MASIITYCLVLLQSDTTTTNHVMITLLLLGVGANSYHREAMTMDITTTIIATTISYYYPT